MSTLVIAVIAGLGGMLGWGLADFFAKKTIDKIGDVQTLAWAGVFGTLAFVLVDVHQIARGIPVNVPSNVGTWTLLLFFGVLQATVYLFAYKGFGKGQLALLNPVFASFSGIVAFISIAFLGEATTIFRVVIILAIFLGVILLNLDLTALRKKRFAFTAVPGFFEVLIATLLAALWTLLWAFYVRGADPVAYSTYMFLFMTIAVFVYALWFRLPLRIRDPKIWIWAPVIGVCETIAYVSITAGYTDTTLVSVVSVLSGGFSLPTIILAHTFLKERVTALQWAGCALIVVGVMLLPLV